MPAFFAILSKLFADQKTIKIQPPQNPSKNIKIRPGGAKVQMFLDFGCLFASILHKISIIFANSENLEF